MSRKAQYAGRWMDHKLVFFFTLPSSSALVVKILKKLLSLLFFTSFSGDIPNCAKDWIKRLYKEKRGGGYKKKIKKKDASHLKELVLLALNS